MGINDRVGSLSPSLTLAIAARAAALKSEGKPVWSFSAGEPDFDTPEHIKAAAAEALAAGKTKYTPASGLPALRSAISDKLKRENGLEYEPSQVIVSNGAKQSLFNTMLSICAPGDEVIIPAPYWLSYPEMVKVAGATPVVVPTAEEDGFLISPAALEKAMTGASKVLILNSPSNPTGAAYSAEQLRELAALAAGKGLYIVSDEIYEKNLYDGRTHTSVGSLSPEIFERTVTINGFSKAFAMTGWRLGYCAAPADVAKGMGALQSHSTSGPNTFAQHGAVQALEQGLECVAAMVREFSVRRDRMHELLLSLEGVSCVKPSGAFYMFPNISAFGLDSVSFAKRLLDEQSVAVVPGAAFGADAHVRLSYACSMDNIEQGLERFGSFVASLG